MPAPKLDLSLPGWFGLATAIRVLVVVNGFPQLPTQEKGGKALKTIFLKPKYIFFNVC